MAGDSGGHAGAPLLLNRYRVEGSLGEGGLGTVVKAFDTRLKSMRAIKTLKRAVAADPEAFRALEERFTREAEAGSRMGINPNLVAVYDLVADTDGTLYLILEYVAGGTLADRLKQGPVPLEQALRWTADACRGLQAAHDVGIVHRDVKPANIFLATDGRAQVGDFGIAQIDDISGRTRTTVGHPGTPLYMSPEQAHLTAYVQPATDQYSLGLVLFEMLAGIAYRRLGAQEVKARLAAFPPPVRALIERMTAENPEDRYPSMGGALAAIQAIERYVLADEAAEAEGREIRVASAGPPGVVVGSPDAPTDASAGTGGTPFVNLSPVSPAPYAPSPELPAASRGRRGLLIGVGGLLIVALIVVGGLFALGRGGSSTQTPQTATAPTTSSPGAQPLAQAAGASGGATPRPSQANGVASSGAVSSATPTAAAQTTANASRATGTTPPTPNTNAAPASIVTAAGAITADGSPVGVKIATPGQMVRLTFAGTDGQAVAVQGSKATFENCDATIALLKPDGSPLGSPKAICGGASFLDQQQLPASGTYTVLVSADKATTGQVTVALYTVVDVTGTIMPDRAPVSVKIATPGQKARYTFSGNDGQIITAQASKATFEGCGTTISLLKPDGSPLGSPKAICGGGGFLDQLTLPASGAYTLLVNPDGATTGGATVMMYTIVDVVGTIMPGGPPVTTKIVTPGQNARYTFAGADGQAVAVQASKATFDGCGTTIAILKPDDSPLGSPKAICGGGGFLDQQTLPTSGTYTVMMDPDGATTGGATLTLYTVVDVTAAITPGGPPVNVKIATPGQKARLTFTGTSGQVVTVQASKATFEGCGTTIAILKPDESPLGSPKAICGGAGALDPQTLPTSGSYTILVNPDGAATGEATVTVSAATR